MTKVPDELYVHKGKQDEQFAGHPALMKLSYEYLHPFNKLADAFLKRYNWETRMSLTTIGGIKQVDDDTVVYYRRQESMTSAEFGWERVTINRKAQTMESEALGFNTDGSESLLEKNEFHADGDKTQSVLSVYNGFAKSGKIDAFKQGIVRTLQAIKFEQFEKDE